jgi:hypothetical protein
MQRRVVQEIMECRSRSRLRQVFHQDASIASIVASLLHAIAQIATRRRIALADMAFPPTKTLSELSVDDTIIQLRHIGDRWASLMPHNKISAR